jgi:hypothetical protein
MVFFIITGENHRGNERWGISFQEKYLTAYRRSILLPVIGISLAIWIIIRELFYPY